MIVEVLLELGLADELGEPAGPQAGLGRRGSLGRRLGARAAPRASAQRLRPDRPGAAQRLAEQDRRVAVVGQVDAGPRGPRRGRSRARPAPPGPRARGDGAAVARRRPAATAARRLDVGHVEPGLQLDQQPGRRLAADAGHEAQGVDVVVGQDPAQRVGRVDREDGQGQRRADAVGAEQRLEAHPLVAAWRSRRGSGRPRGRGGGCGGRPRRRRRRRRPRVAGLTEHPVADAAHLDEHLGRPVAVEQPCPAATDHRTAPSSARASARSWGRGPGGRGPGRRRRRRRPAAAGRSRPSRVWTMRSTCPCRRRPSRRPPA